MDTKQHSVLMLLKLPPDFDHTAYLQYNPDLVEKGITNQDLAITHYLMYGKTEKRIYKKPFLIDIPIDSDFDASFYLSTYPDVASYYEGATHIPLEEKLFHHYINYGKVEGRFKNTTEQSKSFVDLADTVDLMSQITDLTCPINKLECVCLLTTAKEIQNKQYLTFINHLLKMTQKNEISTKIDFYIVLNNTVSLKNISKLNKLKQIFKNVEIINLALPPSEDVYLSQQSSTGLLPAYGLKSGPNICFIQTLKKLSSYNTTLLLETDCVLGQDWLSRLYWYTQYANGFLISGGVYDGKVITKSNSIMANHINGGTALYATNNHILQQLISYLDIFLPKQISYNMPGLAYDYALKLLIDNKLDSSYNNVQRYNIWKFISRNYLACKLIINCSTASDSDLDPVLLMKKYNYAVLHKKPNK